MGKEKKEELNQPSQSTTQTISESFVQASFITKEKMLATYQEAQKRNIPLQKSDQRCNNSELFKKNRQTTQYIDSRLIGYNISMTSQSGNPSGIPFYDNSVYAFVLDRVENLDDKIEKVGQILSDAINTIDFGIRNDISATVVFSCGEKIWTAFVGDTLAYYTFKTRIADNIQMNYLNYAGNREENNYNVDVSFHEFNNEINPTVLLGNLAVKNYLSERVYYCSLQNANTNLAEIFTEALNRHDQDVIEITMKPVVCDNSKAQITILCDYNRSCKKVDEKVDEIGFNMMSFIIGQLKEINILNNNFKIDMCLDIKTTNEGLETTCSKSKSQMLFNDFIKSVKDLKEFFMSSKDMLDLFNKEIVNKCKVNGYISFSSIYQLLPISSELCEQVWNKENIQNALDFFAFLDGYLHCVGNDSFTKWNSWSTKMQLYIRNAMCNFENWHKEKQLEKNRAHTQRSVPKNKI